MQYVPATFAAGLLVGMAAMYIEEGGVRFFLVLGCILFVNVLAKAHR